MNHIAVSRSLSIDLRIAEDERSLRILLAEDNAELRRLLALILRHDGHEVVEARDGSELLEAIASSLLEGDRRQPFDLVICEQGIRGIPGLSVLAGLRARTRDTPFILITENAEVRARAERLGAVILDGPLTVEGIRDAIRRIVASNTKTAGLSAGSSADLSA